MVAKSHVLAGKEHTMCTVTKVLRQECLSISLVGARTVRMFARTDNSKCRHHRVFSLAIHNQMVLMRIQIQLSKKGPQYISLFLRINKI